MRKKETTYTSYRKLTEDRSRLWRTFLLSLLLHVLIISGLYVVTFRSTPKPIEIYKVQLVAGDQSEKTIAEPEPTPPPPPPEPPKPEPPKEEPPPEPPKPEPPKPEPPKEEKPAEKPAEPEVAVPDLIGLDLKQAETKLKSVDLGLGKVDKKCDDKVKTEKVISQNPKAGSKVKKGSGVAVTVQGPCEEEKKPEQMAKKTEPKKEEKKPPEKPKEETPKKTPPKDLRPIVPKEEPIKPLTPPKNEPAPRTPAPGKQARANDRVTQSGAAEVPTALQSWLARVMDKVDRNWIVPEGVRRDEVVDIYFVASREGRLLDGPRVIPREGVMPDAALAESAIQALQRSLPLPPFPDDYPGFEQAVVLGFKASQGEAGF